MTASEAPKPAKRRGGIPPKRTVEEMASALRASHGVIDAAARKLRLSAETLRKHIAKHPDLRQLLEELREDILDQAQFRVDNLLKKPAHKDHAKVAMFILRTLGRKRGFVERHELTGPQKGDDTATSVKVQFYLPEREDD